MLTAVTKQGSVDAVQIIKLWPAATCYLISCQRIFLIKAGCKHGRYLPVTDGRLYFFRHIFMTSHMPLSVATFMIFIQSPLKIFFFYSRDEPFPTIYNVIGAVEPPTIKLIMINFLWVKGHFNSCFMKINQIFFFVL